jgi:hypothetical protein
MAAAMLEGGAEAIVRKVVELALGGDVTCLKLCLERIIPSLRQVELVGETRPSAVIYVPSPIISGGQWLAENRPEREVIDVTPDAQSEAPRELTQLERTEQDPEFSKLAPDPWTPKNVAGGRARNPWRETS